MGDAVVKHGGDHHAVWGTDPAVLAHTLLVYFDGGGDTLTTGIKGDATLDSYYRILGWKILGDVSGSIVIDIWRDTYTNYPPTNADSITASAPPTVSGAAKGSSSTLTGWSDYLEPSDTLRFNIDSVSSFTRVCLALHLKEGIREPQ